MKIDTVLVAAGIGLITPFLVAVGTKLAATWEKTALAFVTVVAGAVAMDLANVGGSIGWKQFVGIIITAGAVAGGSRQWLTGTQVDNVAVLTAKVGLKAPEAAPVAPVGVPLNPPVVPVEPAPVIPPAL